MSPESWKSNPGGAVLVDGFGEDLTELPPHTNMELGIPGEKFWSGWELDDSLKSYWQLRCQSQRLFHMGRTQGGNQRQWDSIWVRCTHGMKVPGSTEIPKNLESREVIYFLQLRSTCSGDPMFGIWALPLTSCAIWSNVTSLCLHLHR